LEGAYTPWDKIAREARKRPMLLHAPSLLQPKDIELNLRHRAAGVMTRLDLPGIKGRRFPTVPGKDPDEESASCLTSFRTLAISWNDSFAGNSMRPTSTTRRSCKS